ncbi:trypsin-like serine peptidase [Bifidobacterium sp.]|jgi:hypothetical protein|uniref:trypsin-like serine peptidase n=1 Tax=Bifidobacterium sp. TaxID=41200 RepID=UPI0025C736F7|nr:trypsin-like peptidase domain-containing protein [Bifidobacterium sp.]MCI1634774.1 trypsin-like peptidase domain-containing protein [Bifidobacterium sp.]
MSKTYSESGNVSITLADSEAEKVRNYWTPERKAAAQPAEEIVIDSAGEQPQPLKIAPANISAQPFSTGGKLFFTSSGQDKVASAEFCDDTRIALTAAHCIRNRDTGVWSENVLFERAYRYGTSAEEYTANTLTCREDWTVTKEWQWDFAFFVTNKPSPITPLPYALNMPFARVTQFGYPVAYDDGEVMQTSDGNITRNAIPDLSDSSNNARNSSTVGTVKMDNNPAGGGCSGGAWVGIGTTTVASLNSFHFTSDPSTEYGPVFGAEFQSLYAFTKARIY